MEKKKGDTMKTRSKTKKPVQKKLNHEQVLRVYSTVKIAIASENSDELKVYLDSALSEMCRRRGIFISAANIAYHRDRIGIPSFSKRLKKLIEQSQVENKGETI